jgi:hypothetical protein
LIAELLRPQVEVHAHLLVRVSYETLARYREPKETAHVSREVR